MTGTDLNAAMSKCLFLLGAGASYGLDKDNRTGCKTSREMLEALEEKLANPEINNLSDPQAEAFRFVISSLEYHNKWRSLIGHTPFSFQPNIEELALVIRKIKNRENFLPYPITGNWADKLILLEKQHKEQSNNDEELFELIEVLLKSNYVTEWLKIKSDSLDYLYPIVEIMGQQSLKDPIEMFTLNYDRTIEEAMAKAEIKPYTGFVSGEWRGMKIRDVEDDFDKLNLYKLHGSLDWVRLKDDGSVRQNANLTEEQKEDIDPSHNPYLVFGHGSKTFSFDPFFDLVTSFKEKLRERRYILTIGYSFFDPYINNLIIEAINTDPLKKIIIVNPNWGPKLPAPDPDLVFDEYKVNNGQSVSPEITEYIRQIQLNSFYSELPEFNLNRLSGQKPIHFMKIGMGEFLQRYFTNGGQKLIELVHHYDSERGKEEHPFQ
jgi:hypothetical protein